MTFRSRDWVGDGGQPARPSPPRALGTTAPVRAPRAGRADNGRPRPAALLMAVALVAAMTLALGLLFR